MSTDPTSREVGERPDIQAPLSGRVTTAIVVLTVDQMEITKRLLKSLAQARSDRSRIVLWDNGSSDGTAESVQETFPWVRVHHHPDNVGVAAGRNRAARIAIEEWSPQFLLFIDNDMTVEPDFLEPLEAPFADDQQIAQTTAKIRDLDRPDRLYGAGGCRIRFWLGDTRHLGSGQIDSGQYDQSKNCIPSGGCMLVRTEMFEELGGFDEIFSPYGPEDLDFGLRARNAGYRALYVPGSVVYHQSRPGRTFESGAYSESYATHRARHWFQFMDRHASISQRAGFYLIGAPYRFAKLALREARRGNLGPAVRGLVRGARESSRD